jgi:hypothetical protein
MSQKIVQGQNPGTDHLVTRNPKKAADLRCSRPLCSSQNTGSTHRPGRTRTHRPEKNHATPSHQEEDPHGPSGPNSAHPPTSHNQPRSQLRKAVLAANRTSRGHCQRSTHEPHPRTSASEMGSRPASWSDAP